MGFLEWTDARSDTALEYESKTAQSVSQSNSVNIALHHNEMRVPGPLNDIH